jgi:nitrite reductase (NADH) small subunit
MTVTANEQQLINVGPVAAIPAGEGRMFEIGDILIAVFHTRSGAVFATQALCPHRDGPLADGLVGDCKVVCPLHGRKFDLGSGLPADKECEALKTYSVIVNQAGDLMLNLDV